MMEGSPLGMPKLQGAEGSKCGRPMQDVEDWRESSERDDGSLFLQGSD